MARPRKTPKKILQILTQDIINSISETTELAPPPAEIIVASEILDPSMRVVCPKCGQAYETPKAAVLIKGGMVCTNCKKWVLVRLHPNKECYVRGLGVTPSGSETLDIADATADLLRGLTLEDLYTKVSEELETIGKENMSKSFIRSYGKDNPWESDTIHAYLHDRFWDKNPGMQRMNLGNILRAAMKRNA